MKVARFVLMFALIVVLSSAHAGTVYGQPQAELDGCPALNSPSWDEYYLGASWSIYLQFYAGDTITISARYPDEAPGTFYLSDGVSVVASSPYPGTLAYTFPADRVVYGLEWYIVADVSAVTWEVDCVAGPPPGKEEVVPGCDVAFPIPSEAVVGAFVADAPTYYEPGKLIEPPVTITAGNTAWVLGMDASGMYYKIVWVCQYLWVPVSSMGPNYDAVWNGTPLPTGTVE